MSAIVFSKNIALTLLILIVAYQVRSVEAKDRIIPTSVVFMDLSYGSYERNVFDLHRPTSGQGPFPLAVYIHGGGFRRGDKSILMRDSTASLKRLLNKGIAVAAINYRYSTQDPYPAPMHDAARAIQFMRYNAREFGIDPERIAAWGGSAGGGISLWLAFHDDLADPDSEDPIARQSTRLLAAAGAAAQTTYDPFVTNRIFPGIQAHKTEMYQALFGFSPELDSKSLHLTPKVQVAFDDASPANHVSVDDPPIFLSYIESRKVGKGTGAGIWVHHSLLGNHLASILRQKSVPFVLHIKDAEPVFNWPDGDNPPSNVVDFVIEQLLRPNI